MAWFSWLVALALGCQHDWDALRDGGGEEALCDRLCQGYDACVTAEPVACRAACEAQVSTCSQREKEDLGGCVDDVEPGRCFIETEAEWRDCIAPINCFDYP